MTETQEKLSEKQDIAEADLLSDVLGSMHLSGVVLFRTEFREPWGLAAPGARQMAQMLPFQTEHIIPFHIVAEGECGFELEGQERIWLGEGDAVLLPYGDSHALCGRQQVSRMPAAQLLPPLPWPEGLVVEHGGAGERTQIICGFVQCDELLFHPLLRHLPPLMHVSAASLASGDWLRHTIRHTAFEACRAHPGSRAMLPRLTELMFVEILRNYMQSLSATEVGWFAAANDPVVGAALKCMHMKPMHDWSVEALAAESRVSRTALTARFKYLLDMTPMHYLTSWRLQLAAQRMKTTDLPVKCIADQAGYVSEAAFSRAFKRRFGLPPAGWRRKQRLARAGS
jgi:AraC family transcriptional regulator, alkane utilization regulator